MNDDIEEQIYIKCNNETEARKEFDNICKQLQEEEIEWTEDTKDTEESQPKTKFAITLTEFWNSTEPMAIHCDTREKSEKLLKAFDKSGKKWFNGDVYTDVLNYSKYGANTCYDNGSTFGEHHYYDTMNNVKIYEFEDVDLEN